MLGSAAFRTGIAPGGALAGPWVRNPLWTRARAVPSLDLRFADNKSLVDATTGASLVTFTRASTGTYVGSDGVLRSAVTNLQTWSEDFRNTADAGATRPWTYNTSAVTADNTIAPNGTSTADLIAGAAGTANKFLSNNISTTTTGFYTFSLYLKQNTEQFVVLRLTDGSANGIRGRFDLTAGTVVVSNEGTATGQAASATAVGNGWYRCVVTCSVSSLPSSVMQPQLWLNNFASTSLTTNYFAWGAQLEQSSTVGEYIPTTSVINSAPRFDHNPTTGESLGLLVEEARTNLLLRSEEFNDASWAKVTATVSANAETSPNGALLADKLIVNNGQAAGYVSQTTAFASGTSYTASCYAKAGEVSDFRFVFESGAFGSNLNAIFNLTTGVVSSFTTGSASIQTLSNGWYRCTATAAATATASAGVQFRSVHAGNGTNGIFLWGAQLEAGAFATSYIPTTTATATRAADVASVTGTNFSSWYNQTEGTLFVSATTNARHNGSNSFPRILSVSDGTNNNQMETYYRVLSGYTDAGYGIVNAGTTQASFDTNDNRNGQSIAFGYASNNFPLAIGGTVVATDTSGTVPTVSRLGLGVRGDGGTLLNGTIKRLVYWGQRLPNATLQSITL